MSDTSQAARCRAGCARHVITPPIGTPLAGYFHDRFGTRVRDDLHAHAVVLEVGDTSLAIVSCDLIAPDAGITEAVRGQITDATGIEAQHIMICATHTHTGPAVVDKGTIGVDQDYLARLPGLIAATVLAAAGGRFTAELRPGRSQVQDLSFNRLFRLRDGSEVFGRRDTEVGNAGPIDPELQTLSVVDDTGQLRALLVNFALHVDVIGGGTADFISADWPGELGRAVSGLYGHDVITLFLQGTCGDINHNTHTPSLLSRSGPPKAEQLGRALAGAAVLSAERAEPLSDLAASVLHETLTIPYYTRDETFLAQLQSLQARTDLTLFEQYLLKRGTDWPYDGLNAQVPLQVMRLGPVAIVGLPAEIFVRLGLEIKQYSPAPFTFVVELANASPTTYVPTTDQAMRGAYGALPVLSRWLVSDAGRRIADAAQVMLWKLWA